MIIVEANHIREMIASDNVKPLPVSISRDFGLLLETYPLLLPLGSSIDWSKVTDHAVVEWYEKTDQQLTEWARTLRLSSCTHVAMWYNTREPCLLSTFDFGIANLDTFTWGAPGPRYMFGVDLVNDGYRCSFHSFIEVTGGPLLHGIL